MMGVPNCPSSGTLADLIAFNRGPTPGCVVNGLLYSGFSWTQTGGTTTLAANQVNYTASGVGEASTLFFSTSGFSVTGNDSLIYTLGYTEDPPPVIIRGLNQQLDSDPPVFPGFADIITTACLGSAFIGGSCPNSMVTLLTFDDGNGIKQLFDSAAFDPVAILGISTLIDLEAKGASSEITGFGNTTFVSPEPSSYLLAGGGLAVLAALRRKRVKLSSSSLRKSD